MRRRVWSRLSLTAARIPSGETPICSKKYSSSRATIAWTNSMGMSFVIKDHAFLGGDDVQQDATTVVNLGVEFGLVGLQVFDVVEAGSFGEDEQGCAQSRKRCRTRWR